MLRLDGTTQRLPCIGGHDSVPPHRHVAPLGASRYFCGVTLAAAFGFRPPKHQDENCDGYESYQAGASLAGA